MCNDNDPFPLSSLIASITGSLSLPCDYADPSNETVTHACAFKGEVLQKFLGDAGLPLQNCRSGSCMAQGTLDNFWANESATAGAAGHKSSDSAQLTGGVIAGLVVLGLVVLGLLSIIGVGLLFRRRAARKPRAPPTGPVGLRWTNLSYTLPRPGQVGSALTQMSTTRHRNNASAFAPDKEAHVMDDLGKGEPTCYYNDTPDCLLQSVSGFAAPGKMVAILGPSGAGKTTLIDLLAGRAKSGTQGGQVAYLYMNDSALDSQSTPASQSKLIAYVDQEDELPALATVREALEFAATLSHTENVPSHERAQLVNRVLDALGLTHVAHRRIGDTRRRGISGGEKRRVSIGLALVARPRILILDEPLSGLNSYSADRVVEALRRLANTGNEGTTVLMTLHQPSRIIFHTYDVMKYLTSHTGSQIQKCAIHGGKRRHINDIRDIANVVPITWLAQKYGIPLKIQETPHEILSACELLMVLIPLFMYTLVSILAPVVILSAGSHTDSIVDAFQFQRSLVPFGGSRNLEASPSFR
ncbi:hypothetical protein CF326_g6150 [Tilletia indica]|nr:hypothetical protein CF326_g6150 [Tilletia indica]